MAKISTQFENLAYRLSGKTFGISQKAEDGFEHPFENRNIHPEISNASRALFDNGHYKQATLEAYMLIDSIVSRRSRLTRLSGFNLMTQAFKFSEDEPPKIALNSLTGVSEENEQTGYQHIFAGSSSGIRNPRAHEPNYPETMEECLDHLSLASLLMRKLDQSS